MNLLAPVSSIMTTDLITVSQYDPVKKAEDIFNEHNIHHLPVIDTGQLIGIVSKADYLFFKRGYISSTREVSIDNSRLNSYIMRDIMTTGLATLDPEDKINVALEIFKENRFHAIPIVHNGALRGIITTYDIISNLASSKGAVNTYELK